MQKGDMAVISYTATDKSNDRVFDSTIAEQAKKAGIFDERVRYEPVHVIIGNKELMPALEEELVKMKEGEQKKVLLNPKKAFGERKAELIKVMPMKEFISREIRPVPGLMVEMNNVRGKVQSVSGGRVRVDFNHELAGKELEYDVKLEKILTEKKEKLDALGKKFFTGTNAEIKEEKNVVEVKFNLILPRPELKGEFASIIFSNFPEIKKIMFIEELEKKEEKTGSEEKPKKEETKKQAKKENKEATKPNQETEEEQETEEQEVKEE
ncbi:peptidylprolyl isomerase [Candidatus Micrarchaeota archaeon]|nr:peptidylprolyl isomerase [Candidatus Micrarchaeota archaeon]MBU2476130.1 peptidylprolyl isomerase [Candidatus Micrarchaeota archaeon]